MTSKESFFHVEEDTVNFRFDFSFFDRENLGLFVEVLRTKPARKKSLSHFPPFSLPFGRVSSLFFPVSPFFFSPWARLSFCYLPFCCVSPLFLPSSPLPPFHFVLPGHVSLSFLSLPFLSFLRFFTLYSTPLHFSTLLLLSLTASCLDVSPGRRGSSPFSISFLPPSLLPVWLLSFLYYLFFPGSRLSPLA